MVTFSTQISLAQEKTSHFVFFVFVFAGGSQERPHQVLERGQGVPDGPERRGKVQR